MQEESPSSMIAPLSDGNAQGIDSSTEAAVVKDEPRAGAKTGKGYGDGSSMPGDGAKTGKGGSSPSPRPQGPAGVGDGDEKSMPRAVNDTELIQRGGGVFTERRWRKQPTTEILVLNTHIKRHLSVESYGETPRSVEQEDSRHVGHACFIDTRRCTSVSLTTNNAAGASHGRQLKPPHHKAI